MRHRGAKIAGLIGLLAVGCGQDSGAHTHAHDAGDTHDHDASDTHDHDADDAGTALLLNVLVLLDGQPVPGAQVGQGGTSDFVTTDALGQAQIVADLRVTGDLYVTGSHPAARIRGARFAEDTVEPLVIELTSYITADNPDYAFQHPGTPTDRDDTSRCAHCHQTINDQWFASPHRTSASNPVVHDLYAGTAHTVDSPDRCAAIGGTWTSARLPGGGRGERCFVGQGALQHANPDCAGADCLDEATQFAQCADCHAPAINGTLGRRDLLEAEGIAHDFGISCDVCHRVDEVVPTGEPGVAGRLRMMRPSEEASISLGAGGYLPLTFGPNHDVPNPRMGVVQRDHFADGTLCMGCHQHDAPVAADRVRWPDGMIPLQSTWAEWEAGAMHEVAPCGSCHMPPDASVANTANLERFVLAEIGVQGGWIRPAGATAFHSWWGPRQPEARMLELAAAVFVNKSVQDGVLTASVTVRNTGAGHAIPTGEAMRNLVLTVEARCGDTPLNAIGGDVVPDFGGALEVRDSDADLTRWPGAQPGDVLRVLRVDGWHSVEGFGPFGDRFSDAERGMAREIYVGQVEITAVADDGTVTLSAPLPAGDRVVWAPQTLRPGLAPALAGSPGWGFARVLVDAQGRRSALTFAAVDVASDNRLMPQSEHTSTHLFAAGCAEPTVQARLLYRNYSWWLARERGWTIDERVMAEVEQ